MNTSFSKFVSYDVEGNQKVVITRDLIEEYASATPEIWGKWRYLCDNRSLPKWFDITEATVKYSSEGIIRYLTVSNIFCLLENDIVFYKDKNVYLRTFRKEGVSIARPIDW